MEKWRHRHLSIMGKITIVNSLVNTLFIHKFMSLPTPPLEFFTTYKRKVMEFIWDGKIPKISYIKLVQDYTKLGLKLTDLETKNKALKASWPIRWLNRTHEQIDWIFNTLAIKDNRIWNINISKADVIKIGQNRITKQHLNPLSSINSIWQEWAELNFSIPETYKEILEEIIWGNTHIRKMGKPIFEPRIINSNIDLILDIIHHAQPRFLNYEELVNEYGPNINQLEYYSILASIPPRWKVEIRNNRLQNIYDMEPKYSKYQKSKSPSKLIYWTLIEKRFPTTDALPMIWNKELTQPIETEKFWELFTDFRKIIKPAKLQLLQYRILTKTLTTNKKRNIWDSKVDPKCSFCHKNIETQSHLFTECEETTKLWKNLERWLSYYLNHELKITKDLIMLNNFSGPDKEIINTCIIALKHYIYSSKCLQIDLKFTDYVSKLSYWHKIETITTAKTHTSDKIYKKWNKIF